MDDAIIAILVENLGNEARHNALNLVRVVLAALEDAGLLGLDRVRLDVGILFLQVLACARQCTARADTGDVGGNVALGVTPDFRTGGLVMRLHVDLVRELTGSKAVLRLGQSLLRFLVRQGNAAVDQAKLGTVCLNQLAALDGHALGHVDDNLQSVGGTDHCQADTGVAGGGLDDGGVLVDDAALDAIVDDGLGNAVFHRAAGVLLFQLAVNICFVGNVQLRQRGIADKFIDTIDCLHGHDAHPSCLLPTPDISYRFGRYFCVALIMRRDIGFVNTPIHMRLYEIRMPCYRFGHCLPAIWQNARPNGSEHPPTRPARTRGLHAKGHSVRTGTVSIRHLQRRDNRQHARGHTPQRQAV